MSHLPPAARRTLALLGVAGAALLPACVVTTGPIRDSPAATPTPPRPGPPAPAACRPGVETIGVLVVSSDGVYVNNQRSATGRVVCDGDDLRTDATGVGDVVIGHGNSGESIHLAENTDPRLRWTAARCISIDNFERGVINVNMRQQCAVVRTANALLYQPAASRTQYVVTAANTTEVKPVLGPVPVKLQLMSDVDVRRLSTQQLLSRSAPVTVQPQQRSLNVYRAEQLVQPPRPLTNIELRSLEVQMQRSPLIRPQPIMIPR